MIAYSFLSETGEYNGPVNRQLDQVRTMREGREIYLMPANSTTVAPPDFDESAERAVWDGSAWRVERLPEPLPPSPPGPRQPTDLELAQQEITDKDLEIIANAQALTDLELMMIGGIANV